MDPLHALRLPIGSTANYRSQLEEIQGNILRGHGRAFANQLLVRFHAPAGAVVGQLAQRVTSAWDQEALTAAPFVGIGLSAVGYAHLGYPFPAYNLYPLTAKDLSLPATDLCAAEWKDLSAIVIVASDDHEVLARATIEIVELLNPAAIVSTVACETLRHPATHQIVEHFGFADSISQPCFFADECAPVRHTAADPAMGPYFALFPDPFVAAAAGSFLVALQIEQDLHGFRASTRQLAASLAVPHELAEAYVVGRFRDGTPLAISGHGGNPTDDFDYAGDPSGSRCPLASHARQMAPRDPGIPASRESRIARRGMSYGRPTPINCPDDQLPRAGQGLLFQCVQRDLRSQFRKLYMNWAGEPGFPERGSGRDALLYASEAEQNWPTGWQADTRKPCGLRRFVRILGGEYFFLPSIPFLHSLAQ